MITVNFRVNGIEAGNKYPETLGEFVTLAEALLYAAEQCRVVAVGKDDDGDYLSVEDAMLAETNGQPATGDVLYLAECGYAEVIDLNTYDVVATYGDK